MAEDLATKQIEIHKTEPIWLLARNSAPLAVRNPSTQSWTDLTQYLGAFVTPHRHEVMEFLRQAVDQHIMKQLTGYKDQYPVISQVKAIYNALKKHVIGYISSVIDFHPDESASTQWVRLPRETLGIQSANCLDGTLLFASLLEAISLNPALVFMAGHVLLGWETGKNNNQWQYMETTMIGNHEFEDAVDHGYRLAQIAMKQQAQLTPENPSSGRHFRRWSIKELRIEFGITPME